MNRRAYRQLHASGSRALLFAAACLCGTAAGPGRARATQWQVGAAKVDITPSGAEIASGRIWLGGFGSCASGTRRATGVHDSIYARAMVISDGSTVIAHVMADTVGISNRRIKAIQNRVFNATGIPANQVMVGATHTHAGPDMQGLWCGVTDSYKSFFDAGVARAVIDAHRTMQTATLGAATSTLAGKQRNRRGWGFTDQDLAVVQALDSSRRPIATLVEFAAHATCLGSANTLIARDWVGGTQDQIEARGGGIAVVNAGNQGDVTPAGCGGTFADAAAYGASIADAAYVSLANSAAVTPPLSYAAVQKRIPVTNGLFLMAWTAGWMDYDLVYPCKEGGGAFGNPCIATLIAYFRMGPAGTCHLQAAVAPGEMLTRGGLRVEGSFRAANRLFLGLTHNALGYAVPDDEWNKAPDGSTYEESVSPTRSFGETVINAIVGLAGGDSCQ